MTKISKEWAEDCLRYCGKILTGKYRHWCVEWDLLPIDETCPEFNYCSCWETDSEGNLIEPKETA